VVRKELADATPVARRAEFGVLAQVVEHRARQ
jgi:hypothetical protein